MDSMNITSERWKAGLGYIGAALFGTVAFVGGGMTWDIFKEMPRNRRHIVIGSVVAAVSTGVFIGLGLFASEAMEKVVDYDDRKDLLHQLRKETVGRNQAGLERFTDFLNEHGRLVDSESAS